ncbi:hypothetical protein F5877DRAFT_71565 [Lentinula edodes]|nr:hypothetical protein F5877DRAFT_71565 [Lentinula edodes]
MYANFLSFSSISIASSVLIAVLNSSKGRINSLTHRYISNIPEPPSKAAPTSPLAVHPQQHLSQDPNQWTANTGPVDPSLNVKRPENALCRCRYYTPPYVAPYAYYPSWTATPTWTPTATSDSGGSSDAVAGMGWVNCELLFRVLLKLITTRLLLKLVLTHPGDDLLAYIEQLVRALSDSNLGSIIKHCLANLG